MYDIDQDKVLYALKDINYVENIQVAMLHFHNQMHTIRP